MRSVEERLGTVPLTSRLALIAGTSSCHMAVSHVSLVCMTQCANGVGLFVFRIDPLPYSLVVWCSSDTSVLHLQALMVLLAPTLPTQAHLDYKHMPLK